MECVFVTFRLPLPMFQCATTRRSTTCNFKDKPHPLGIESTSTAINSLAKVRLLLVRVANTNEFGTSRRGRNRTWIEVVGDGRAGEINERRHRPRSSDRRATGI